MKYFILSLLLIGCSTDKVYLPISPRTHECMVCGLKTNNYKNDCNEFINKFNLTMMMYEEVAHREICPLVNGYKVVFLDVDNGIFLVNHKPMQGATDVENKVMLLGSTKALSHEIGHILDHADKVPQIDSANHKDWDKKGYCQIGLLSGENIRCRGLGENYKNTFLYNLKTLEN
jgi:hypothetical protein